MASLSVREGDDGKLLLNCFAGCDIESITEVIGIKVKDLFPTMNEIVAARYPYTDADGTKLYEKVRYEPKDFRISPRGYKGERVPYRLPDLLASGTRTILWVEGEKDADALAALGFVATTAGGVNDWRAEMARWFTGREVVILPDNDDPGRAHGRSVASALAVVAKSVSIAELPGLPPKGDVSDWIKQHGADKAKLLGAILKHKERFDKDALQTFAEVQAEEESWVWFPRLARGAVSIVFGEAGIGKSTIMLDLIARLSRGGQLPQSADKSPVLRTVVVGVEGPVGRARGVLQAAGANLDNVAVVRQDRTPEPDRGPLEQLPYLAALMKRFNAQVLFVDNVAEAMQSDTDTNNEYSVRRSMRRLCSFAEENGYAVIMISHPKKNAGFSSVKEAITGSQAFTNLPRSTFLVAPVLADGKRTGQYAIACAKSNLYDASRVNTLVYELRSDEVGFRDDHAITTAPRVHWVGVTQRTAQELLEDMRPRKEEKSQPVTVPISDGLLPTDPESTGGSVLAGSNDNGAQSAPAQPPVSSLERFLALESDEQFAARMMAGAEAADVQAE